MKEVILVSACLLGECVRYNGDILPYQNDLLELWQKDGKVLVFCPEVEGGLPVPRPPAEIVDDNKVKTREGKDVTENFLTGAQKGLETVLKLNVKAAVLKDGSPSCGSSYIYDGTFSEKRKPGKGILTSLFEENGIKVFCEREVQKVLEYFS